MLSILTLLIELLIMTVLQALGITDRPDPYILVLICIFSIVYMIDLAESKKPAVIRMSFFIGYVFRVALLMLDIFGRSIYVLPHSGSDSEMFYHEAVKIANGGSWETYDMDAFAGNIFKLIGISRLYMQFIFLCFSLVALYAVDKIMQVLNVNIRCRKTAMAVLCLLPNYAILSISFLRESLIAMMIAISLLLFVKWIVGQSELYFWLAFLPVMFAAMFHGGVMGVLIGYCLVRFLYNRKARKFNFSVMSIASAVVVGFLMVYLFNNYAEVFFGKMRNVEEVTDIATYSDGTHDGGSSYAKYVGDSSSVLNMIIYTPIRIIMYQFTPFVWQIRSLSDVIAICFNALFYIYVWYKTIKYVLSRRSKHRTIAVALLIVWFATTFVFAWGVTNVGTAIRHRDKMVALAGVLLGLTMNQRKEPDKVIKNE